MFPMKDGIKRCLYTKLLVNCILFKAFIAVVLSCPEEAFREVAVLILSDHKMAVLSHV